MLILFIISAALSIVIPMLLGRGLGSESPPDGVAESPHSEKQHSGISVVIAAKDEADHLPGLFEALQKQDFAGDWEVVLVLDRCRDDSELIAAKYTEIKPLILRIATIEETPEGWTGKKWALEQGIKTARYNRIALTDADCLPESGWLRGIAREMDRGKELVLGLGLYRRTAGLLNLFVRFETHLTAMQYIGFAGLGMPYMGVGRNMAYSRAFFQRAGGFSEIAHRLSGDDDLLVNQFARAKATGTMTAAGTRTISEPPQTFSSWWRQKIRHLSAGTGYRMATQFILSLLHGLQAIFYLSLVGALCSEQPPELVWGIYAGRTLLAALFWNLGKGFRMQNDLLVLFPILDIAYLFYNLIMVPASLFLTPKWKSN